MQPKWDANQPIYRQVKERVLEMILDGDLGDGDTLPSVRAVAAEYQLNPLTVLKGYQELADEGLVEKQRGKGMFVTAGARERLLGTARRRFIEEDWPRLCTTIERLGLDVEELLALSQKKDEEQR
jgi:GntR family transcriptional regulator